MSFDNTTIDLNIFKYVEHLFLDYGVVNLDIR